jgi:hypothetical protein
MAAPFQVQFFSTFSLDFSQKPLYIAGSGLLTVQEAASFNSAYFS